ncbi:MAG: NAD(P)/FAD-dependent oxidoreductase [Granulosicoccus sp.]
MKNTVRRGAVPSLDTVTSDSSTPNEVDVVVVGGGIAGICTALFLAEKGVSVCVCEKGVIAGEQSSRNWGWTRQMGRDPLEMPLSIESLKLWRSLEERFGIDAGYRETGISYICRSRWEIEQAQGWAKTGKEHGLPLKILGAKEIEAMFPGIAPGHSFGLHTSSDGKAEPALAVPAFAAAAQRLGASIVENCAVRGIETSAGRVSAAVTEKGTIRCSQIVVAGGVWSRLFLGNSDVQLPQLKLVAGAARVDNVSDGPELPVGGATFGIRRRLDGGYTVGPRNINIAPIVPDTFRFFPDFFPVFRQSWREIRLSLGREFISELKMPRRWSLDQETPFELTRMLNPAPPEWMIEKSIKGLKATLPGFANARITHSWGGVIDATPDGVPVIDGVDHVPGLFIASGLSGHGFGAGPAVGQLMAQIITGDQCSVDPKTFRFNRFRSTRHLATCSSHLASKEA